MKKLFVSNLDIRAGGKNAFDRGTFTFDSVVTGITDFGYGKASDEIPVPDTETVDGANEFLVGKVETHSISFTGWHDTEVALLATRTAKTASMVFTDDAAIPKTTTFSGSVILFTADVTGSQGGGTQVAYTGKFTGAVTEVQA